MEAGHYKSSKGLVEKGKKKKTKEDKIRKAPIIGTGCLFEKEV